MYGQRVEEPRPLLWRRLSQRELVGLDVLAGAGYALVMWAGAAAALPGWAAGLVAGAIGLPVAFRRCWPWPVFGTVFAATVVGLALGVREPFVAAAFALYLAALRTPRGRREPTIVIAVVSGIGLVGVTVGGPAPGVGGALVAPVLVGAVLLGAAWTMGRAVRERRAYATRTAVRLAEQAATEERLRIARDLHDIVSHTLSMIGVKAGIANHVADDRPEEAREALRVIETTSREALSDMRQMLGLLRAGAEGGGIAGLSQVAERAAAAGVPVDLDVTGLVPQEAADTVYRIVQEAVTNAVAHGGPSRCRVTVTGSELGVRVEVSDDGRGSTAPFGHGLTGMRERVARHGGSLTAGPRAEGGFTVSAWLPLGATAEVGA